MLAVANLSTLQTQKVIDNSVRGLLRSSSYQVHFSVGPSKKPNIDLFEAEEEPYLFEGNNLLQFGVRFQLSLRVHNLNKFLTKTLNFPFGKAINFLEFRFCGGSFDN